MSISKVFMSNLSDKPSDKKKCRVLSDNLIVYIEGSKEYETLKNGYLEMSTINLEYSEICCEFDFVESIEYESWLSESDKINDNYGSKKRRYILCRP